MASPYGSYPTSVPPTPLVTHPRPITPPTMALDQPAAERIRRHPRCYYAGGDVFFLVQNFIFRVHRYFFERESPYFREKLGIPAAAGQTARGSSDANPLALDDVRADDFEKFLWVFYNPKYSIYDATVDEWEAILKLAFEWRFSEIKKLCCRELEKYEIEPVRKIAMYQAHELDKKLLIPAYAALTIRPEPLSFSEGRKLGLETALMLATAREIARTTSSSGARSPMSPSVTDELLAGIVRDVFGLAPGPPSPDLTPLDTRGVTFAATPVSPRSHALSIQTGASSPRPASPTASAASGGQSLSGAAAALADAAEQPVGDLVSLGGTSEAGATEANGEPSGSETQEAVTTDPAPGADNTEPPATPPAESSPPANTAEEVTQDDKKSKSPEPKTPRSETPTRGKGRNGRGGGGGGPNRGRGGPGRS
ncbi:hypothetical protein NLI96_g8082 [Meripilus lineatus]|uniref:BTB domain-containing protein n=1 Tax=Meripilus lineatus TaxID=2056292 RepID=A0AAD5UZX2_9APHY|nr:hypothetical protein NLI96_g8082 [Physisporinus lineatus]